MISARVVGWARRFDRLDYDDEPPAEARENRVSSSEVLLCYKVNGAAIRNKDDIGGRKKMNIRSIDKKDYTEKSEKM